MIRFVLPDAEAPSLAAEESVEDTSDGCTRLYDGRFCAAYAANTLTAVASGLTYRYADFVTFLGGTEFHLGWIVGVGMIGSVLMRLWLGTHIDHRGPRLVWLASLAALVAVSFGHLAIQRHDSPPIYLLRIAFCTALAGVWGASTTFISSRCAARRMAEAIGMLGTSGFVGIMFGTQLGDALCVGADGLREPVDRLFIAAGLAASLALPFAWVATRGLAARHREKTAAAIAVLRRHQPAMIFVVGTVAGAAIALPATFLRTYAQGLRIPRIGLFFAVCAVIAVVSRFTARRLPERLGLPRMILVGLGVMIVSQFLFLAVKTEWELAIPAVFAGVAQAILFPTIVTESSRPFPGDFRGLGTTVILASFDLGQVLGAPAAGAVLHYADSLGLPDYPTLFVAMAAMLAVTGGAYWRLVKVEASARAAEAVDCPAI